MIRDIDKFEAKSEQGIFLGYSETSQAYKIYNLKHECVEESPHVIFDESVAKFVICRDGDDGVIMEIKEEHEINEADTNTEKHISKSRTQGEVTTTTGNNLIINICELKSHPWGT